MARPITNPNRTDERRKYDREKKREYAAKKKSATYFAKNILKQIETRKMENTNNPICFQDSWKYQDDNIDLTAMPTDKLYIFKPNGTSQFTNPFDDGNLKKTDDWLKTKMNEKPKIRNWLIENTNENDKNPNQPGTSASFGYQ